VATQDAVLHTEHLWSTNQFYVATRQQTLLVNLYRYAFEVCWRSGRLYVAMQFRQQALDYGCEQATCSISGCECDPARLNGLP
jgi:hypothetical protein